MIESYILHKNLNIGELKIASKDNIFLHSMGDLSKTNSSIISFTSSSGSESEQDIKNEIYM